MRCNAVLPTERRWGWARTGGEVELYVGAGQGRTCVQTAAGTSLRPYVELRGGLTDRGLGALGLKRECLAG